jgi:hypothetical protein
VGVRIILASCKVTAKSSTISSGEDQCLHICAASIPKRAHQPPFDLSNSASFRWLWFCGWISRGTRYG